MIVSCHKNCALSCLRRTLYHIPVAAASAKLLNYLSHLSVCSKLLLPPLPHSYLYSSQFAPNCCPHSLTPIFTVLSLLQTAATPTPSPLFYSSQFASNCCYPHSLAPIFTVLSLLQTAAAPTPSPLFLQFSVCSKLLLPPLPHPYFYSSQFAPNCCYPHSLTPIFTVLSLLQTAATPTPSPLFFTVLSLLQTAATPTPSPLFLQLSVCSKLLLPPLPHPYFYSSQFAPNCCYPHSLTPIFTALSLLQTVATPTPSPLFLQFSVCSKLLLPPLPYPYFYSSQFAPNCCYPHSLTPIFTEPGVDR